MKTVTTQDKIAELKRELAMRHRVYPSLPGGAVKEAERMRQIQVMEAMLADYEAKLRQENPTLF